MAGRTAIRSISKRPRRSTSKPRTAALDRAGLRAADVDALVTVSTTGVATPSLEARVAGRMGFRDDAERVPVFGLGCAGGVSGLAIAARLARGVPGRTILFVTVELCSTSIRLDKFTKANIVATALFGDGAAACVLRAGEGGIAQIEEGGEILWPDTLGIMGWDVEDPGLGVIFDRAIPPFVEENMARGVAEIMARTGVLWSDIDSLHLPSRRRQGDRRARAEPLARGRRARS